MRVFIERGQSTEELDFTGSVKDLLSRLQINTEDVLVIRNGTLVTEDEQLDTTDDLRLLSVVSGG